MDEDRIEIFCKFLFFLTNKFYFFILLIFSFFCLLSFVQVKEFEMFVEVFD